MLTNKKLIINQLNILQKDCIDIIEKELDSFFELRIPSVTEITDLLSKGSIKTSDYINQRLDIMYKEIKKLVETIENKLSNEISYSVDAYQCDNIAVANDIKEFKQYLKNNIDEMIKTEQIAGLCEKMINKFLSIIFDIYLNGNLTNYCIQQFKSGEKILHHHSLKMQKLSHSEIIVQQIYGFMLNLKTDLRNKFVYSTLSLIASLDEYYDDSIVA